MAKKGFLNIVMDGAKEIITSGRDNGKGEVVTDTFNAGSAANVVDMLPANTAVTGAGQPQNVANYKTLRIEVWGSGTCKVKVEVIGKSETARAVPIWDYINSKFVDASTITAAGFYDIDVQGFTKVQVNVTEISGTVNASGAVLA